MANSDSKPIETHGKSNRKRPQIHPQGHPQQKEEGTPDRKKTKLDEIWSNLDLVLSLQSKDLDTRRKIEIAFDFVTSKVDVSDGAPKPVSIARLISFLSDWIQPLLISLEQNKQSSDFSDSSLDYRAWVILRFCLKNTCVSVSPNLLKPVTRILKNTILALNNDDLLQSEESRLLEIVADCLASIFSSNARAFYNANIESWVSCAVEIVDVVRRILANDKYGISMGKVILRLSSLLLEYFANFLKFHPNPKSIFRIFVDRLLELLLELLVLLQLLKKNTKAGECGDIRGLLKMAEDVLSNGLFHPVHIGGFFNLRSLNSKQEGRESKGINESYHRHFFKKLEKIITEKKVTALSGFGYLFGLFIGSVKSGTGASLASKGDRSLGKSSEVTEEGHEKSKPLFEVFMHFLQPLLLQCKRCAEQDLSELGKVSEDSLIEARCLLISVNEILVSFIKEKIYVRTEDTSEGAHYNFLREVYDAIVSISSKIYHFWLSTLPVDDDSVKKMLPNVATEIVISTRFILEIEYKAVEDDLVNLWLMMFSYLAAYLSIENTNPSSFLISETLNLGCKLIDVYSELRQVSNPLFALCKAVRFLGNTTDAGAVGVPLCVSFPALSSHTYVKSVETLLCSQELQLAISNAVKSIPEGQSSGCIKQLTTDITDSLEWIRRASIMADGKCLNKTENANYGIMDLDSEAELLGRLLSEVYAAVLDSITVTATNSRSIGSSMEDLMNTIRPSFSILVQNQPDCVGEFIFAVTGRRLYNHETSECHSGTWTMPLGMSWVFVFFFRMYISCRSLYRQSISLMPPHSSRKASELMGSFFTVACGVDWEERAEAMDEGYFSWIVKPSISLLDAINFLSEDYLLSSAAGSACLVYVIHVMVLQRLFDLNRLSKAFEFLQKRDITKSRKNWKKVVSITRQEAAELTYFMTRYLKVLNYKGHYMPPYDVAWNMHIGSLDKESLQVAIWRLLCQNTDTWCVHASDKHLKYFLSALLLYSIPCGYTSIDAMKQHTKESFCQEVTMHGVALEFFTDIVSYEQTFMYKYFASRFCRALKKSLSPILTHASVSDMDLGSKLDWSEFLKVLEKGLLVDMNDMSTLPDLSTGSEPVSVLPDTQFLEHNSRPSCSSFSLELRSSESLLNLLSKMPKVLIAKSFSVYARYVMNLERLVVSNLLNYHGESFIHNRYELFRLFTSCRRAMKYLVMAFFEENLGNSDSASFAMFHCSSSILWLLKSVSEIASLPHDFFGENCSGQVQHMTFSLMDHTSCIFLAITEGKMNSMAAFLLTDGVLHGEQIMNTDGCEQGALAEACQRYNISEKFEAGNFVELMTHILEVQGRKLLVSLKSSMLAMKSEARIRVLSCSKLSSFLSCFQGFLWGLISSLDNMPDDCPKEGPQSSQLMPWCLSKVRECIAVLEDLVNLCLNVLIVDDNNKVFHTANFQEVLTVSAHKFSCSELESSSENNLIEKKIIKADYFVPSHEDSEKVPPGCDHTKSSSFNKQQLSFVHANSVVNIFLAVRNIDLPKLQKLKSSLFQNLLKGESPKLAVTLRQLFTASAAILKLKNMLVFPRALVSEEIHYNQLAPILMGVLIAISQLILQEMADMVGRPDPFSFVWLDGIMTFLEVVGSTFAFTDHNSSRDVYAQLIDTHLRAIGKCISLQGKAAALSSHETGSNTKTLQCQNGSRNCSEPLSDQSQYPINAFKTRLRMSFKKLVKSPAKLHVKTVIQALEQKLVGVHRDCSMIYEVNTGDVDGGKISSIVAAGIDCFDLVLESVSGHKPILKENIPNLVSAVFNIVLHLQNQTIFYIEKQPRYKCGIKPDAGSAILMCVEILTKVVGGGSLPITPCHVSQCLYIPSTLFNGFCQLRDRCFSSEFSFFDSSKVAPLRDVHHYIVDHQFSVELYASCCRLLSTTLKHRKYETEHCIAVLEESVSVLLNCLEVVDANIVRENGCFAWGVQEGIKCASFLRRIYEEIRHQKDDFGKYSSYFLSDYICTYSGYGPLKAGIKREVDEALRPGVYSLIDICTEDDYQQLHTLLGEGPCRSTLKTLLHDYKLNFQYEGKI